jgi:hypothetical protein
MKRVMAAALVALAVSGCWPQDEVGRYQFNEIFLFGKSKVFVLLDTKTGRMWKYGDGDVLGDRSGNSPPGFNPLGWIPLHYLYPGASTTKPKDQ